MKEKYTEAYLSQIAREKEAFRRKQGFSYEEKISYAKAKIQEFIAECEYRTIKARRYIIGKPVNYHVSVGGLDSIVLLLLIRSMGYNPPAISVSSIEDKSIQAIHKALGVTSLLPVMRKDGKRWSKALILQEFGFPILSKEIAAKIELLQNPSTKNATVRHAIITGETGAYGGYRKNTRMKLAQKWLELFGGYENENEGTSYKTPDFLVSSKCCYYLKEKPCDDWAKAHNSVPFLGLMASEGGRREKSLMINGCNYWGKTTVRSAPFAIFLRQDILQLALEMDEWWRNGGKEETKQRGIKEGWYGADFKMPDSIIPTIYGEIAQKEDGTLYTTKAQRTGCSFCGFGIQLEKRPHRFDLLRERNPQEWDYWMYRCCTDKDGNKYGWGKVLDYIGVEWQ